MKLRALTPVLVPLALMVTAGCAAREWQSTGYGGFGQEFEVAVADTAAALPSEQSQYETETEPTRALCRSQDGEIAADQPTCATEHYFDGFDVEQPPPCESSRPIPSAHQKLEVRLYRGTNVGDDSVVLHARELQKYFAPHGLLMTTDGMSTPHPIQYALTGSEVEFDAALTEAGISPTAEVLTEEEKLRANAAIGQVMFAPVRAFFEQYAVLAEQLVNVVVIERVLSPSLEQLMNFGGTVVGLGLSPILLSRLTEGNDAASALGGMLQVDEAFTPTLFIGHRDIESSSGNLQFVVAHEMGHALGLPHDDTAGNLMHPAAAHDCTPWLNQSQMDKVIAFARAGSMQREVLTRVRFVRDELLKTLLTRRKRSAESAASR